MSPEERQLLAGLFDRMKSASSAPRDQEAEAFIAEQVKLQPAAPYLLSQTVIVQDQALQGANQRLQQLEAQVRQLETEVQQKPASGGFLGGLFGGGARQAPPPRPPQGYGQPQGGPWGAPQQGAYPPPPNYAAQGVAPQPQAAPAGGGSFLKGALGAAAGVAGGVLLADSIRGLFHGGGGGTGGGGLGIGSGYEHAGGDTVINNYYGDDTSGGSQNAGYDDPGFDNQGGGQQDADFGGDGGFDSGGDDTYDA